MDNIENVRDGVKACLTHNFFRKCYHCPYELYRDDSKCKDRLCEDVLELLNKQQAEIERLKAEKADIMRGIERKIAQANSILK